MDKLNKIWIVLALYRIARLLSREDGPYYIFSNHRRYWGRKAANGPHAENIAEMVHCPHCLGIWLAPIVYWISKQKWGRPIIFVVGLAGAQDFLQTLQTYADTGG